MQVGGHARYGVLCYVAVQHRSWAYNGAYELTELVLAKSQIKWNFLLQGF